MKALRILFFLASVLPTVTLHGQKVVSMSVLQDLPILSIDVRPVPVGAGDFELRSGDIAHRMKTAMAGAGTQVLPRAQPGVPELRATIRLAHVQGPSHLYVVELELVELVRPERTLTSLENVPATTWQRMTVGIANSPETVLKAVSTLTEGFAEELALENQNTQ